MKSRSSENRMSVLAYKDSAPVRQLEKDDQNNSGKKMNPFEEIVYFESAQVNNA